MTGAHAFDDPGCVSGRRASRTACDIDRPRPGHLAATFDHLDACHGVTVAATSGAALATAPTVPVEPTGAVRGHGRPGLLQVLFLTAGAVLLGGFLAEWSQWLAGREPLWKNDPTASTASSGGFGGPTRRVDVTRLAALAPDTSAPPAQLTPAQGGYLLNGVNPRYRTAWLLTAAQDGHLALDGNESHPTLTRSTSRQEVTRDDEDVREVLDRMFAGRDAVTLGVSYDRRFTEGWDRIGLVMNRWSHESGLVDRRSAALSSKLSSAATVLLLVGLIGVVVAGIGAGRPWSAWPVLLPAAAALAGAGLMLTGASEEVFTRTAEGNALWLRVEGFRRYLATAQEAEVRAAADAGVLDLYTAWAVSLGEVERWSAAVERATSVPHVPAAYRSGSSLLTPLLWLAVVHAVTSSTSRVSVPGMSSASFTSNSGGDGASVGDGAGGGGGGSW
ncbi:hypothetical protein [Streptomyces sp. NPDC046939]|uniref:DUF2207 family protein n=1 Tax=Streptomyces sp. NPDC046939 TaxID=3155376 RepID=UPI0033F77A2B